MNSKSMTRTHAAIAFVLASSLTACGREPVEPHLIDGPDAGETKGSTATLDQPILEGRSYVVKTLDPDRPTSGSLVPQTIRFEQGPEDEDFVSIASTNNPFEYEQVARSSLIALACAYEIANGSKIIPPGTGALNPGTPITNNSTPQGNRLGRVKPALPSVVTYLTQTALEGTNACASSSYWKQEMQMCIARHYLEFAETGVPYDLVLKPIQTPAAKTPASDWQTQAGQVCQDPAPPADVGGGDTDPEPRAEWCSDLAYAIEPGPSRPDYYEDLRKFFLMQLKGQFLLPNTGLTIEQTADEIARFTSQDFAVWPVQKTRDAATLALLAVHGYQSALKTGNDYLDCATSDDDYVEAQQWLDTYEHELVSVKQMIIGNTIDGMQDMIYAAELANKKIVAEADARMSKSPGIKDHQLRWRGRINSRLEAVHAMSELDPDLFQSPEALPEDVAEDENLYSVYPWIETSEGVKRAEALLREARIDPRLIDEVNGDDLLANALRFATVAQMPQSLGQIDDPSDPGVLLAHLNVSSADLRIAANRLVDQASAMGRALIPLDPIPTSGPMPMLSEFSYTYGTDGQPNSSQAAFLYSRSIGSSSNSTERDFVGIYHSIGRTHETLTKVVRNLTISGSSRPFFPDPEDRPTTLDLATVVESSALQRLMMIEGGRRTAATEVPGFLITCGELFGVFSAQKQAEFPELWRGDAGLECALEGGFGGVSCDEEDYRILHDSPVVDDGWLFDFGMSNLTASVELNPSVAVGVTVYLTRKTESGAREPIAGFVRRAGSSCTIYPYGPGILEHVRKRLAPDPEDPGQPAECCVGLPCNLKVPLEDSLQSTPKRDIESSYMHYLALARSAANRADELGEEIYRQGLEMDRRAEDAREELEEICGGVVNVDILGPKVCTTDAECCRADTSCDAECTVSPTEGVSYCTGGTLSDAIRAATPDDAEGEADLSSVEQCLGAGNDKLVAAAVGDAPLWAWQEGSKPLCACDLPGCPTESFNEFGQAICPAKSKNDLEAAVPDGFFTADRIIRPIKHRLNFQTQGERKAPDPSVCRSLAQIRAGIADVDPDDDTDYSLGDHVNVILSQPWMSRESFARDVAAPVEFEFDLYGFLNISMFETTWLSTGSELDGPERSDLMQPFPMGPLWPASSPLCNQPTPRGGQPLGCRSIAAGTLTPGELARMVELIHLFSGSRSIPVGGFYDVDATDYGMSIGTSQRPLPEWLANDNPGGYIADVFRHGRRAPGLLLDNAEGENDATVIRNPGCLTGVADDWVWPDGLDLDPIVCPDEDPLTHVGAWFDGKVFSERFRWSNGADEEKRDGNADAAVVLFDRTADDSWGAWLSELVDPNGEVYEPWNFAPLLSDRFNLAPPDFPLNFDNGDRKRLKAGEALDSLELACMLATDRDGPQKGASIGCPTYLEEVPNIRGPQDFPQLTARLRCSADRVDDQLDRMWIPEIPESVANSLREGEVTGTFPTYRGSYNVSVSNIQSLLETMIGATRDVSTALRDFAGNIEATQTVLDKLENESEILDWRLIADVSNQAAACASAVSIETLKGLGKAADCVNAAVQITSAIAIQGINEENLAEDEQQALRDLATMFTQRMDALTKAAQLLHESYTQLTAEVSKLNQLRSGAQRATAKALALDSDPMGRVYNVNTSMRRRMSTLRVRYEEALDDAKKMAFIAQRAIEQRLAVNLTKMNDDNLLLVDQPSSWVPDLCKFSGIDYDRIRDSGSTPVDDTKEDNYADGYVGDYVTKLENFVESYRFAYPFQDGSDVAVISLSSDVMGVTAPCDVPSHNLLYWTGDFVGPIEEEAVVGPVWSDYSDEGASVAFASTALAPTTTDGENHGVRTGMGRGVAMSGYSDSPSARAYWGQELVLDQGSYVLSWYELVRNADSNADGILDTCATNPPAPGASALVAQVLGTELPDAVVNSVPELAEIQERLEPCWRRWFVRVDSAEQQRVRVRIGIRDVDQYEVIWAAPQLETVVDGDLTGTEGGTSWDGQPRDFQSTTDVLTVKQGRCEDTTGTNFQELWRSGAAFCEPVCSDVTGQSCSGIGDSGSLSSNCYYEINFGIPAGRVENGELGSSVAGSNFNYRFSRFGINLVGTGLLDCEQSSHPSTCYAGGFVQYSLQHNGKYVVRNHKGEQVPVDLFPGRINHAKALAAERFLTNPLSGSDRQLMEDFWREELRGRPMQGTYTLRLYDISAFDGDAVFDFRKLEDVQLIFEYNYWSRSE